jgi:hypothetical protein
MDQAWVIQVLLGAFAVVGTGLVSCLVWFAIRVVNQLDRLETLVIQEAHSLDLRVSKLEAWRDGMLHIHEGKE